MKQDAVQKIDLEKKSQKNVEIHHWDKKKIPFGTIISRYAVALILSFYGPRDDVHDLMQRTSHLTRVYFVYQNRLRGFLEGGKAGIISSLKKDFAFYLSELAKHHKIEASLTE